MEVMGGSFSAFEWSRSLIMEPMSLRVSKFIPAVQQVTNNS